MTIPQGWRIMPLSEIVSIQRGFDLPHQARRPGPFPVLTSGDTGGFHDEGPIKGPGVTIGRATNLGQPKWSDGDFWPHNTTMFVKDFMGNEPRWVFHFFENTDLAGYDSGSVQPMLNRNYIAHVPVFVPPIAEQRAIAEVLGALDDKIAANTKLASTASDLAGLAYDRMASQLESLPMSTVLKPVLGGTPPRSRGDLWMGDRLWASAKDITGADFGVVTDTDEKITDLAVTTTKAKPLPTGSVILTARGTVGAVARLAEPASFNQSCYGFVPGAVPPGVLYFSVLRATQRAKEIAHGSVFDTITMKTFDHLVFPNFDNEALASTERHIGPVLAAITARVMENAKLAATRDALLPQLMSGRLRVRDAEKVLEDAV
ncbi:restriction endonuclease subunit S [Paeniglutamicibacter antarcticus]|uniref:Restriction endonuclease subunit S n=1 Tax=Arthrobacter terrae TaxID=2935737 RepID=A0A931CTI6_9MICC|nr:restriction endonuclease subunit S [Arthrobacter terrae]MBG0740649.1 restriction endonuclease subunit S [Arthrobacter terrae]